MGGVVQGEREGGVAVKQEQEIAGILRVDVAAVTVYQAEARVVVDLRKHDGDFDPERLSLLPVWLAVEVIPRGYAETVTATVRF